MMTDAEKPPLGRREARKAERRAAILAIARGLFLEHGYARMSMSAIVEAMGGSKATLWSYFASKEELFAAVIEDATLAFRSVMQSELDPRRDMVEVLENFAEKYVARITAPDAIALQRLIISEVERFPEIGRIFYQRAPGMSRAFLTTYIADRMEAGLIEGDDPEEVAGMLLSLCAGHYQQCILWGMQTQSTALARAEAERAVRQFLRCHLRKTAAT